ncbi:hypothetical protein M3J09_003212 [Ascochyta lentis]
MRLTTISLAAMAVGLGQAMEYLCVNDGGHGSCKSFVFTGGKWVWNPADHGSVACTSDKPCKRQFNGCQIYDQFSNDGQTYVYAAHCS